MTAPSDLASLDAPSLGERVVCEHADRCGGCPLIGLSYPEQLEVKRGHVVRSIARYPALECAHTEPVAVARPVVGYRTRAKLIVGVGAKIGLFAKGGGHQVVDIPRCRVLAPTLARVAAILRAQVAESERLGGPLTPFESAGRGSLRAIDLREVCNGGPPQVLVTFVVQRTLAASPEALTDAARKLMAAAGEVVGVAANFHDGDSPQILGGETRPLAGVGAALDRVGASVHQATFGSFVQAHRAQASRVHALLVDGLGIARGGVCPGQRSARVLDLYGGSGAIALGLAAAGASVHMVESFAPAVAQARAAAQSQSLDVQAEHGDAAAALRNLAARGEHFDAIVVNPPRRGTSPTAREWLARLGSPVIAYVSCDPGTLARDLDHLARLGYATTSLRPLDMIPLTDEVETVALLHRCSVPAPRVMYEDHEILVVDKGPHEPTVPHSDYAGSLVARVRRGPGGDAAEPIHRLDAGASGLVVFVRRGELVNKWRQVLAGAAARKIFVAAVRGVMPVKGAITRELREDGRVYEARTRYRRLAIAGGHSVLRVVPEQGRPHQIRRHLAAIGRPVIGDERYGHAMTNRHFEEKNGLDRSFLHCVRLEFDHPDTGLRLIMESPLPGDLRAVLERSAGPGTLRSLDQKGALGTSGSLRQRVPGSPESVDTLCDPASELDVDASALGAREPEVPADGR